jgi:hypothetical protein
MRIMRTIFIATLVAAATCLLGAGTAMAQYTWLTKASFIDPRSFGSGCEGAAANYIAGKIYVSHGYRLGDSAFLSIYDVTTDSWTHGGPLAPDALVARSEMGGGTAFGKHYAIGGRTGPTDAVEQFDPVAATWKMMSPLPFARGGEGCASFAGKIYSVGGRLGSTFGTGPIVSDFVVFDPLAGPTGTWSPLPPTPTPICDNYATVAFSGKIYVFGGVNLIGVTASVMIYDISTGVWAFGPPMPAGPRGDAMCGVLFTPAPKIAVFGGYDGFTSLTTTEIFDVATGTWDPLGPPVPSPVSEMAQGVTWDGTGVFSIGSGIFGVSGPPVYELVPAATPVAASTWGALKASYRR